MRIISKQTLVKFYERYPDSKKPLMNWYNIAKKSTFSNVNQVKQAFNKVSILSENRIVFNIKGNNYRLIVAARFQLGIFYICWVGAHDEYDKIDANKIWDY
jgi:mRNA interferase HigB